MNITPAIAKKIPAVRIDAAIMSVTLDHAAPIGLCLVGGGLPRLGGTHSLVHEPDKGVWLYDGAKAIAALNFGEHDPFVLSLVMEKATTAVAVVVFDGQVRDSFELPVVQGGLLRA